MRWKNIGNNPEKCLLLGSLGTCSMRKVAHVFSVERDSGSPLNLYSYNTILEKILSASLNYQPPHQFCER